MSVVPASSDLGLYTSSAQAAAARVIDAYSTSFGLATSLLPAETRTGIRSIYALVRVADEIVDGTAEEAGLDAEQQREVLDALESETLEALERGFSANLVVHAFAVAARASSLEASLVTAFFASMRRDLEPVQSLSREEYSTYIYGSAEVVGLMCLRVFLMHETLTPEERADAEAGASSLGAAFQKVNFLRDLGEDAHQRGRAYFPGTVPGQLSESEKVAFLREIEADLAAARKALPLLPPGPRRATALAASLFGELAARLRTTPAEELQSRRVSVPPRTKLRLLMAVLAAEAAGGLR
ncbi:phytoene/squalene synthase family protein [Nesterenkonia sp. NBAIMH1]|uniref:phytoene/squalene synthase family protein n=1 Tax=Nesterenkonia sp. NBAIMH1 TaxID=2600320 RepID=UPI0011B57FFD|nr:phytoene/squalene synthase family protein [Nesterenkonia sp. NBAIMH1]